MLQSVSSLIRQSSVQPFIRQLFNLPKHHSFNFQSVNFPILQCSSFSIFQSTIPPVLQPFILQLFNLSVPTPLPPILQSFNFPVLQCFSPSSLQSIHPSILSNLRWRCFSQVPQGVQGGLLLLFLLRLSPPPLPPPRAAHLHHDLQPQQLQQLPHRGGHSRQPQGLRPRSRLLVEEEEAAAEGAGFLEVNGEDEERMEAGKVSLVCDAVVWTMMGVVGSEGESRRLTTSSRGKRLCNDVENKMSDSQHWGGKIG